MTLAAPLLFDEASHVYRLNGVVVPSVTQVLRSTSYVDFYRDLTEQIAEGQLDAGEGARLLLERGKRLDAARGRGQRVHNALHYLLESDLDLDSLDEETIGYMESAQAYLSRYVRKVYRAECRVWSTRHGCAGTLDLLAEHSDGAVFIGDFKTGSPDDVAADLQLAAYLGFALEMAATDEDLRRELRSNGPIVRRRSIRLFRDGRVARDTVYSDSRDYTKFLNALSVVHDQARRPRPVSGWDDER